MFPELEVVQVSKSGRETGRNITECLWKAYQADQYHITTLIFLKQIELKKTNGYSMDFFKKALDARIA